MKTLFYTLVFLIAFQFYAGAQWQSYDVPHLDQSWLYDVEMPDANTVWASVGYGTLNNTNNFLRTIDDGVTWSYDSITEAGVGAGISSISPTDANTCYAAIYNGTTLSKSGIYKTTDGGATWAQLGVGQIFDVNSFPDFVHFWNATEGMALGDANGGYLEIYTTTDAGVTWTRVPQANLPATTGTPFSITNEYTVVGNRMWFHEVESDGSEHVYRSDDMGLHWQGFPITTPDGQFIDIAFTDALNGAVNGGTAAAPYILTTTDGGATWNGPLSYSGPLHNYTLAAVPGTSAILSCDINGSSYSLDLGNTWIKIDNKTHSDMRFLNGILGWGGAYNTLSTDGGGIYKWSGTLLPVSLTSFTATNTGKSVLLNWQTANELNNNYFAVERSTNGLSFQQIAAVKSKGNSSQTQQYSYEDFNFSTGQNYYRLKQVDNDGKFAYSKIVSVDLVTATAIRLYPNPVKNILTVEGLNPSANTRLSIFDISGKALQQLNTTGRSYTYNLQQLPAGSYYLKVEAGGKVTTLKFVKE